MATKNSPEQSFEFIITPESIVTNPPASNPKCLLIKLGDSVCKSSQLGVPMRYRCEAMYSQVKQKYLPLKGIIKVYDILAGGNEIISCVGAFQTEEFARSSQVTQQISKVIGSTTINLRIVVEPVIVLGADSIELLQFDRQFGPVPLTVEENLGVKSESSHHFISEQCADPPGELQVRRTSTLHFGEVSEKRDIVDLKSAANFGSCKSSINQSLPRDDGHKSNGKLIRKFTALQKQESCSPDKPCSGSKVAKNHDFSDLKLQSKLSVDNGQMILIESKEHTTPSHLNMDLQIESDVWSDRKMDDLQLPLLDMHFDSNASNSAVGETGLAEDSSLAHPIMMEEQQVGNESPVISDRRTMIKRLVRDNIFGPDPAQVQIKSSYNFSNSGQNRCFQADLQPSCELSGSNASATTSVFEYQKNEIEILGEELVKERRRNIDMEGKIEKLHYRILAAKEKHLVLQQQWDHWCYLAQRFVDHIAKDQHGQYIFEVSQKRQLIGVRYLFDSESEEIFFDFIQATIKNCQSHLEANNSRTEASQPGRRSQVPSEVSEASNPQFSKLLEKIEETYANNSNLIRLKQELQTKLNSETERVYRLQEKLESAEIENGQLEQQNSDMKKLLEQLQYQLQSVNGINNYLKEKDQQLLSIIEIKESTIENLKKLLQENNEEMDGLEEQLAEVKRALENKDLMLEELREEIADKEELIEAYRVRFGEIDRYDSQIRHNSAIEQLVESRRSSTKQQGAARARLPGGIANLQNSNNISIEQSLNAGGKNESELAHRGVVVEKIESVVDIRYERSLLLSVIEEEKKMYQLGLQQAEGLRDEVSSLLAKLNQYIEKLQGRSKMFMSQG